MSSEWGPHGFTPWRHQEDGLELLRKHDSFALLDDVGCGKTAPLIMRIGEILTEERKTKPHTRALIISETSPIAQYPGDFVQLGQPWSVGVITGKMTTVQKRKFWADPPDVICTNFEYVKSIERELRSIVATGNLSVVVVDEGHNLAGYRGKKSKSGTQAKRIIEITKGVKYKYLASASLLDNPNSSRVWGPVHWLDPRILPPTITLFERTFYDNFSPTYKYKQLMLKPSMQDELTRRLQTISRRVTLSDLGDDVPEVVTRDIFVTMSPKLRKFYRSLRDEALAWHEDRPISRSEVLSRNMALLQVASGFVIDHPEPLEVMAAIAQGEKPPEHQIIRIDTSHKDKAMENLAGNLGAKDRMIVWAHHTHEIDHLTDMLPDLRGSKISVVDGRVLGADRDRAIRLFKSGRHNTFLGQPGACGAGLNLQEAQHMCRWSRSHFVTDHNQSIGRNRRALREQLYSHLGYWPIMTDQTVDVRTEMRNRGKAEFAGQIMLDHLSYEERNLR